MSVLKDQILITVWWALGKKWFRAKLIADTLKTNVGGIGSVLSMLHRQGLLEVKEEEVSELRKHNPAKTDRTKYERKRVRQYRLSKDGLKVVRKLIGVGEADG